MVVQHLEEIEEPPFKVTVRAVRDRYTLLSPFYTLYKVQKANG